MEELGEILISHRPNFMNFEHNTLICVAMKTFGTEFGKNYCKRSFIQKKTKISEKNYHIL